MPFDLIIFDCDGVLIDSELLACQAGVSALAELNIHYDLHDFMRRFVGRSAADCRRELEAAHGPLPTEYHARSEALRLEAFERHLQPIPGVEAVLETLQGPRCVASSSSPERLAHSLGLTGLQRHFGEHVYSSSMVARGKPAPDLFLHAASRLGAAPGRCVVIEDSVAGVQAGIAAGMTVLGFTGASHCPPDHAQTLTRAGAHATFAHMSGLPALLARSGYVRA
ncbi:HAD superfamily hydrolase (TIGR01509 family) [Deinobacterium chartae]|uniref:HAD superfamily hydrolase (TIGR01509 family) n=1 Tax=Deinobacterium chartae TaxID=521158 RepID=A0A841I078_9DEIO|nr:HAD family hydrolase [Deinobacterium chartae]MBB6098364.1 HAD superfamily hydrolase (TIGR01509 family) [Deinobacterium chartae]